MNKLDKSKSPIAIEEEIENESKRIYNEFIHYTDGFRVLFLIHRNKEGGKTNNTKVMKIITRNQTEYMDALRALVREMYMSDIPYRIYASVNKRDINKAIRQFKYEQLDSDYFDQVQKENFYLDIKNRWIGCMMQPAQRATSLFVFDVDDPERKDICGATLTAIGTSTDILKVYPTKNGWHIITKPFNYTEIVLPEGCSIQKDGLILLAF